LLNISLPQIRQDFESLISYYPYFQLKEEINFISSAFGKSVAGKMVAKERKRVIRNSRANIQTVRAKFYTIFSEIERAVYPIGQLLAREQLSKKLSEKFLKYFPHGAQATLIGIMLGTTSATLGGLGIVSSMLCVRTLNDVLSYFRADKETAAQVKKAFEMVYPWWRLLQVILPVAVYEAAESVDEDSAYCYKRDIELYKHLSIRNGKRIEEGLESALKREIRLRTRTRYREIVEDSGIRFGAIVSDLQSAIEKGMNRSISELDKIFVPGSLALLEESNG